MKVIAWLLLITTLIPCFIIFIFRTIAWSVMKPALIIGAVMERLEGVIEKPTMKYIKWIMKTYKGVKNEKTI